MRKFYIGVVVTSALLLTYHMSYAEGVANNPSTAEKKESDTSKQDTVLQSSVKIESPVSPMGEKSSDTLGGDKTAITLDVPSGIHYIITGYVEDVYFPGGSLDANIGSACYVAFNGISQGSGQGYGLNKYETSRHFETYQFAERARILKTKIKVDMHKLTGTQANDIIGIHFADTNATWWGQ